MYGCFFNMCQSMFYNTAEAMLRYCFFGTDGKMTTVVNGIYFDGSDYYYKQNGVIQKNLGLIEFEGDYYFVCYSGKLKIGTKYVTDSTSNGLLPAGSYTFGVDGKMIKN